MAKLIHLSCRRLLRLEARPPASAQDVQVSLSTPGFLPLVSHDQMVGLMARCNAGHGQPTGFAVALSGRSKVLPRTPVAVSAPDEDRDTKDFRLSMCKGKAKRNDSQASPTRDFCESSLLTKYIVQRYNSTVNVISQVRTVYPETFWRKVLERLQSLWHL